MHRHCTAYPIGGNDCQDRGQIDSLDPWGIIQHFRRFIIKAFHRDVGFRSRNDLRVVEGSPLRGYNISLSEREARSSLALAFWHDVSPILTDTRLYADTTGLCLFFKSLNSVLEMKLVILVLEMLCYATSKMTHQACPPIVCLKIHAASLLHMSKSCDF